MGGRDIRREGGREGERGEDLKRGKETLRGGDSKREWGNIGEGERRQGGKRWKRKEKDRNVEGERG